VFIHMPAKPSPCFPGSSSAFTFTFVFPLSLPPGSPQRRRANGISRPCRSPLSASNLHVSSPAAQPSNHRYHQQRLDAVHSPQHHLSHHARPSSIWAQKLELGLGRPETTGNFKPNVSGTYRDVTPAEFCEVLAWPDRPDVSSRR
jgi:hypothetical protein